MSIASLGGRNPGKLTRKALKMALHRRQPEDELVHHSDQGSQYTAGEYQQMLKDWDIQASMNGTGTWYDNAPMESFFGTLKSEWVHHHAYGTRDEARADIFYYIEVFYNRYRLHSALGYLSPADHERLYYREQASD